MNTNVLVQTILTDLDLVLLFRHRAPGADVGYFGWRGQ